MLTKKPYIIDPGQQLCLPSIETLNLIEQRVIDLTNQFRLCHGLPALSLNYQLSGIARFKAEDMRDKNYEEHISPTFGSPFNMMQTFGITFHTAAENIAGGQATPEEAVNAWITHPSHLANLLSFQFRQIGIGYAQGGSYGHYWSQMFID